MENKNDKNMKKRFFQGHCSYNKCSYNKCSCNEERCGDFTYDSTPSFFFINKLENLICSPQSFKLLIWHSVVTSVGGVHHNKGLTTQLYWKGAVSESY